MPQRCAIVRAGQQLFGWAAAVTVASAPIAVATLVIGAPMRALAEGRAWSEVFAQAETLLQRGQLDQALESGRDAYVLARANYGPDDLRTTGSERVWLTAQVYLRYADHESATDVLPRLQQLDAQARVHRPRVLLMDWRIGPTSTDWPLSRHVILTFADFPNHHIGVYSSDLAEYLESQPAARVPVIFELTYDETGSFESERPIQIGELTTWRAAWDYAQTDGDSDPSPW